MVLNSGIPLYTIGHNHSIINEKRPTVKYKFLARSGKKTKSTFLLLFQRLWITLEFFNRNGLANHAAGGAYGFLLSAAPALLIISFFVNHAMAAYPELVSDLFRSAGFLSDLINIDDLAGKFLGSPGRGLAGVISIISILWTVRICALSVQRGLMVIFPGSGSNPLRNVAVTLGLGLFVILFVFSVLLGSRVASVLYSFPSFSILRSGNSANLALQVRFLSMFCLPLMILAAYRFVPAHPPKLRHIIPGIVVCLLFFEVFSSCFALIINPSRYNLIYGALGRLFLFLANVYFFFASFFFGAQMVLILDSSEALLFIRFRAFHSRSSAEPLKGGAFRRILSVSLKDKLFVSIPGPLEKYLRIYKTGETVFCKGSREQESYYVISGKAGVYLDNEFKKQVAIIDEAHFFGEMEAISSEERAASIRAETDLHVLRLPPELFHSILQIDPDTDETIIKALSERLKSTNKQIMYPPQNPA